MSISAHVEASLKASFWELFETRVGFSKTTGYDWGRVDSYTKSDAKSFTISLEIPPHENVMIESAVGNCGNNKLHTQMYRFVLDY